MEKPSPIFTAESLAAAQNELGDQASISDAMALCKSQYESTPEFKAANAMNSARDIGYTAALVDVIAARPDATGSAQEVLDAWTEAINALTPQPPA